MHRRSLLAGVGSGIVAATAGCLGGGAAVSRFELVNTGLTYDDPPEVSVDDETNEIVVRGTVQFGSSTCSTVELAHTDYQSHNDRLDVLVTAADDALVGLSCTDDLGSSGYEARIGVDGRVRRVAATEHHAHGETTSTTLSIDRP